LANIGRPLRAPAFSIEGDQTVRSSFQIARSTRRTSIAACVAISAILSTGQVFAQDGDGQTASTPIASATFSQISPRTNEQAKRYEGATVSGKVVVLSMKADGLFPSNYQIHAIEDAPKIAGAYMKVQQHHWIRVTVNFTVSQETSYGLQQGDSVFITAHVAGVRFSANQNIATGGRGNDNLVVLNLDQVQLGSVSP